MIHEILPAIQTELNKFFKSKHNLNEDKVLLSNLVNMDGSLAIQETDKIVMTLVNVEQERSKSNTGGYEQTEKGGFLKVNAPININITILFAAYFTPENYLEGIKFLSSTIAFFQSRNSSFDPQNTPGINGLVERLQAELMPLEFRELSNVWSGLGAKYLPSVVYRIKTIPIQHKMPTPVIPYIKHT
jgi:Pvc16 N-terminal domain